MADLDGPVLIATVAAIGITITLIFNIIALRENSKSRLTASLNELIREHIEIIQTGSKLQYRQDCGIYATTYFDLMNRIAYLSLKNQIPIEIGDYFRGYFKYALLVRKFATDVLWDSIPPNSEGKPFAEYTWPDLDKWCKFDNISMQKNLKFLPRTMRNEWKEHNNKKSENQDN